MNDLMRRRRALMGQAKIITVPLVTLTPGTGVKIDENGALTPYIYLGIDSNGHAIAMRENLINTQTQFNPSGGPEYDGSNIDRWLQGTCLTRYSAALQARLRDTNITYAIYDSNNTMSIITISRKIFIPSRFELGGGDSEGGINYLPALQAFYGTTWANGARRATVDGGSTTAYWTRTELGSSSAPNRVQIVSNTGSMGGGDYQWASSVGPKARPMLSFDADAPVSQTDEGYVVCG